MKVPKPIHCFLKKCDNLDCECNNEGECYYGVKFEVWQCGEYRKRKKEAKP